jgi:hypothetical protein
MLSCIEFRQINFVHFELERKRALISLYFYRVSGLLVIDNNHLCYVLNFPIF